MARLTSKCWSINRTLVQSLAVPAVKLRKCANILSAASKCSRSVVRFPVIEFAVSIEKRCFVICIINNLIEVITGDPSKLPGAIKHLIDFVKDIPFKGPHQPYDPHNYNLHLCHAYGGFEGPMGIFFQINNYYLFISKFRWPSAANASAAL